MTRWAALSSLRWRLLAGTVLALALALLLAGLALTALFRAEIERQFDDGLRQQLDQLTALVEFDAQGQIGLDDGTLSDPRWRRPYSGLYWQVDGAQARGVLRSRSLWDATLANDPDALPDGSVHRHDVTGPQGAALRVLERAVYPAGQPEQVWRLLVAADGSRSLARAAWGIGSEEHDYGQTLLVCSVATDRAPDGTAYERFTSEGPVALLPMAGGHYGGICGVRREAAEAVLAMGDAAYRDYLQQRFGWRAGRITRVGARSAYPILRVVAERLTAPRGVVMGNAAQTLHPIGAQGFNLGLRDALTLAEVLSGDDPGAAAGLAAYAEARREDRERTLAFSDGLARLTASEGFPLHVLRSLGLLALGHVPGLADPLVAGAMGFRGRVPELSRGRA